MNILMIGDSWGVPNYLFKGYEETWRPEHHTKHRLEKLGYHVYNFSLNGFGIVRSMQCVDVSKRHTGNDYKLISHPFHAPMTHPEGLPESIPEKIDWTVMFHTEVLRDPHPVQYTDWPWFDANKTFHENLMIKSHEAYSYARDFMQQIGGKLAVIGGQTAIGPTIRDVFYSYLQPDFIIEDWRSEIIGVDLPECYTVSSVNGSLSWALQGTDNWDVKAQLVEAQEIVIDAMDKSDDFPDCAHPGADAHEKLTNKLHEVFQMLP